MTKEGSAEILDETITIIAGGADILGMHDEFHFAYMNVMRNYIQSVELKWGD